MNFLLEILTEEIPSTLQQQAELDIKELFILAFNSKKITFKDISVFSTPRRLTILVKEIADIIENIIEEKKGPKVNASKEAIDGFLKTYNLKIEDCERRSTNNGEFYFFQKITKGGTPRDILPSLIVDEILCKMKFKRSLRWNDSKVYWARPIRNILSLLDGKPLILQFADVESNNITFGHRFLSNGAIPINTIEDYFDKLENNFVILSAKKRIDEILKAVKIITLKYGVEYYHDDRLLAEIAYLVEYPCVLESVIPDKYMTLPKEFLVNIIVTNQRYIPLEKEKKLFNRYIIVSNLQATDGGSHIIGGNNKVLQSRLEDGLFFYNNDLKEPLINKLDKLKDITFFEGMGTIYDKTQRVGILFKDIFKENQSELCNLYKLDLVSEVVREIPELQGIMGYYYLLKQDYNEELAICVKEHYKPQGINDGLPSTILGAKLALLDKLDTLIEFFKIGKIPTGSKDPFALRRAALGIIRISLEFKIDINLKSYLSQELREFLQNRLIVFYLEKHTSMSERIAYIVEKINKNTDSFNIYQLVSDIDKYCDILQTAEGQALQMLSNRLQGIIPQSLRLDMQINDSYLVTSIEKELHNSVTKIESLLKITPNDFKSRVEAVAKLKSQLDTFLDSVIINQSESKYIEKNRFALLSKILHICNLVFEF